MRIGFCAKSKSEKNAEIRKYENVKIGSFTIPNFLTTMLSQRNSGHVVAAYL
jgi:hypothetical protein